MASWIFFGNATKGKIFQKLPDAEVFFHGTKKMVKAKRCCALDLGHGQTSCIASINSWKPIPGLKEVLRHCVTSLWPVAAIQNLPWSMFFPAMQGGI